jgi:hypothetical protein
MNDVIIQCFILEFGRVLVVVLSGGRIDFWTLGCGRDKLVKGVKKSVNHGHRQRDIYVNLSRSTDLANPVLPCYMPTCRL